MENKNIYIEARGGTGGDEAKIWANDLLRMYLRFANKKNWKVTIVNNNVLRLSGKNIFDLLKNESGVHRVQRIPTTERHGRIHTSTATIVVLPEIGEKEIKINPADLDWQFFRASTQGGQNVQKVSTAVRLKERFQEQNRKNALDLLRSKLWEKQEEEKKIKIAGYRSAIGRGMRSEKIRTYNFPQNRITDHRVKKSWGNLESILDGNLEKVVELTSKLNS